MLPYNPVASIQIHHPANHIVHVVPMDPLQAALGCGSKPTDKRKRPICCKSGSGINQGTSKSLDSTCPSARSSLNARFGDDMGIRGVPGVFSTICVSVRLSFCSVMHFNRLAEGGIHIIFVSVHMRSCSLQNLCFKVVIVVSRRVVSTRSPPVKTILEMHMHTALKAQLDTRLRTVL